MKTVKIPDLVHKELKRFCVDEEEKIEDFSGYAIMKELKSRGHKFIEPKKMVKFNPNNKAK
jgi:hypothetical protein